jgi:hypothetical protein
VTRPPVAGATLAEGAAPPRRHLHDHRPGQIEVQAEPFWGPVVLLAHRGLFVAETDHHVAFGRGVHFCLGVALARMEARTAFSAMLHHMPNWNTERIGGTAGHTTIPRLRLPPHQVNQGRHSRVSAPTDPTGTGWR